MRLIASLRRGCLPLLLVPALGSCGWGHGGNVPYFAVGFDVHGASNSVCTLRVANGSTAIEFTIAAPQPPVADTSIAQLAPPGSCPLATMPDAGPSAAVSSAGVTVSATRSSGAICVRSSDRALMDALGYSARSAPDCPATVTLTCGGVVLYDSFPWHACAWEG